MIYFLYNLSNHIGSFWQNLINTLISIIKIFIQTKFSISFPKITSNKATILANGPSLRTSLQKDIDFIKDSEIYCVNNFASAEVFTQIKPQNYVMLDPSYFKFTEITEDREDIKKTLNALCLDVSWKMSLYVPVYARKSYLVKQISFNNNIQVQYFNYTIVKGFSNFRNWIFSKLLGMPQCQNILAATLYVAITRQHPEVYLFGADHSWIEEIRLNEENELIGRQLHFYDNPTKLKLEKIEKLINKPIKGFMAAQMLSLHKAFYSYEVLADYGVSQDVKIYNASAKSYIDSFEKIKINTID